MGFRLGLIGLAGLLALAGTGEAKPVQTTRYTYYTISGSSPLPPPPRRASWSWARIASYRITGSRSTS
jgi:hypothetical protein